MPTTDHVEAELANDLRLLEAAEKRGEASFRTWITDRHAVVVGRAVVIEDEVDVTACGVREVRIVRRPSGGRSVVVGPGTLQYSFALPYRLDDELRSIPGSKEFCNRLLLAALDDPRVSAHESGDLVLTDRKIAGLAMKRTRQAFLLHGTILLNEDLDLVAELLRHPVREPDYRRRRSHADFLSNLGPCSGERLQRRVHDLLARHGAAS